MCVHVCVFLSVVVPPMPTVADVLAALVRTDRLCLRDFRMLRFYRTAEEGRDTIMSLQEKVTRKGGRLCQGLRVAVCTLRNHSPDWHQLEYELAVCGGLTADPLPVPLHIPWPLPHPSSSRGICHPPRAMRIRRSADIALVWYVVFNHEEEGLHRVPHGGTEYRRLFELCEDSGATLIGFGASPESGAQACRELKRMQKMREESGVCGPWVMSRRAGVCGLVVE